MYAPPYYSYPYTDANGNVVDYQYTNESIENNEATGAYPIAYPYPANFGVNTEEEQVDYSAQTETLEQQAEREQKEKEKNKRLELWGNAKTMNLDNILHQNILASPYFKGLK